MIDLHAITPLAVDEKLYSSLQRGGLFLPFSDDIILMQFTGLFDSKGVEVFEGDIVKTDPFRKNRYDIDVVEWNSEDTGFSPFNHFVTMAIPSELIEVIGNIFEHSHLLDPNP